MTELRQLAVEIFVYRIESLLQLLFRKLAHGVVGWVVVDVREKYGLREGRLDVLPRAAVTVPACTNLHCNE